MKKNELEKLITKYKPQYIYQRYNGRLTRFEVVKDNYLVDTDTGMSFDFKSHIMLGKLSKDLIDLIEKDDYVNGYLVLDLDLKNEMICLLMPFNEENQSKYNIVWNTKYFIKSILTHEQFEQIKYKVKEV